MKLDTVVVYTETGVKESAFVSCGGFREHRKLGDKAVSSVHANMSSDTNVFHVRDKDTPILEEADGELVLPADCELMEFKLRSLAMLEQNLKEGEYILSIDTDCFLMDSVVEIPFLMRDNGYTTAMFKRSKGSVFLHTNDGDKIDVAEDMPYNPGVFFFGFGSTLARESYSLLREKGTQQLKEWWGDQLAYNQAIKNNSELGHGMLNLPEIYNWSPETINVPDSVKIIHYKGKRKGMMLSDHPEKALQCRRTLLGF
jgi:hypothetical protein